MVKLPPFSGSTTQSLLRSHPGLHGPFLVTLIRTRIRLQEKRRLKLLHFLALSKALIASLQRGRLRMVLPRPLQPSPSRLVVRSLPLRSLVHLAQTQLIASLLRDQSSNSMQSPTRRCQPVATPSRKPSVTLFHPAPLLQLSSPELTCCHPSRFTATLVLMLLPTLCPSPTRLQSLVVRIRALRPHSLLPPFL